MNSNQKTVNNTNTTNGDNTNITDISAQTLSDVGIYYSSVIKISDPNNKEVLLHMRGDE